MNECQQEFQAWIKKYGRSECQRVIKNFNRRRLEAGDAARPARKPLSYAVKMKLFRKQMCKCARCHEEKKFSELTDDHYDVNSGERYNDIRNRRLLCVKCNSSKGANSVYDEAKALGVPVNQLVGEQNQLHDRFEE